MSEYATYKVEDFVLDDYFRQWVLTPDAASNFFWSEWLLKYPDKAPLIQEARTIVESIRFQEMHLETSDANELWQKIRTYSENTKTSTPRRSWYWGVAAALLAVLTTTSILLLRQPAYEQLTTTYGEKKSIVLPDSSIIILNANSSIRYSSNWSTSKIREVWLEGEAYFSVVHTKDNRVFKVYTGDGLSIEVLGTSFNVYHRIDQTKVMLAEGKVRVSHPDKSEELSMVPGELVEYRQSAFSRKQVRTDVYSAWTNNRLILDHTSLHEIISMLEENYGIDVLVQDSSLLKQTVSGSMPVRDLHSLIQQIGEVFQITIAKSDNQYIIYE